MMSRESFDIKKVFCVSFDVKKKRWMATPSIREQYFITSSEQLAAAMFFGRSMKYMALSNAIKFAKSNFGSGVRPPQQCIRCHVHFWQVMLDVGSGNVISYFKKKKEAL
jgi:hypothetical protein